MTPIELLEDIAKKIDQSIEENMDYWEGNLAILSGLKNIRDQARDMMLVLGKFDEEQWDKG